MEMRQKANKALGCKKRCIIFHILRSNNSALFCIYQIPSQVINIMFWTSHFKDSYKIEHVRQKAIKMKGGGRNGGL